MDARVLLFIFFNNQGGIGSTSQALMTIVCGFKDLSYFLLDKSSCKYHKIWKKAEQTQM